MLQLFYTPPLEFLGTSVNLQYRILKYKKLTLEAYGGLKFIFASPPDYVINPILPGYKDIWYINFAFNLQLNLGIVSPYADLGTDGMKTIGAEVDLYAIRKKLRRKFRPPYLESK